MKPDLIDYLIMRAQLPEVQADKVLLDAYLAEIARLVEAEKKRKEWNEQLKARQK